MASKADGLKNKAQRVYRSLKRRHARARLELEYGNALELLVATILSAQCTDARVNRVTARLFRKYRSAADYVRRPLSELERDIRETGFFRQKANSIRRAAERLVSEHGGRVPDSMEALTQLPGVGRKTANLVLGHAFGIPGIAVDTHVSRVSQRIGLTGQRDPAKIEADLAALFPKKSWTALSHVLIFHGRYVCKAKKPGCGDCPVAGQCDYFASL
ncbi:MAG: endonuclease III [Kiritimatiellae bacterium]|nr:endonuclease III [Kiritimatiellia bacterium]